MTMTSAGKPMHVLLKIGDDSLAGDLAGDQQDPQDMSLAELMASLPDTAGIEYEPARVNVEPRFATYD